MGRILAIDFGKKRTGLAVTDPLQIIATGLKTVETEKVFDFLKAYIAQENVECFVVGLPLNLDGTPTDATLASNQFVEKLQKLFPKIPIEREDERYTSKMAARTLVLSGVKKKKRRNKKLLDEVSATIILQSYLGHHTEMF